MRGRKRKPAAEHVARGTWRRDRHAAPDGAAATAIAPTCPAYLKTYDRSAAEIWTVAVGRMRTEGVSLAATDLGLELFVALYVEYRATLAEAKGQPCVVDSEKAGGMVERKRNPLHIHLQHQRQQLLQIGAELGLTPAGRARLLADLTNRPEPTGIVAQRVRE